MAKVKVLLDPIGNTMNIWWGDPKDAHESVEVDDPHRNDVIIKDRSGKPISIEIVGIFPSELNVSDLMKRLGSASKSEPFFLQS